MSKRNKDFYTQPTGKGGWLDKAKSTYSISEQIGEQPYYWHQRIGKTKFIHPGIFCDVNYGVDPYDFYDETLDSGDVGITDEVSFTLTSDGDLIVDREDEAKFFIEYSDATLKYKN